jgi:Acetyltransferase (GNAT) domain
VLASLAQTAKTVLGYAHSSLTYFAYVFFNLNTYIMVLSSSTNNARMQQSSYEQDFLIKDLPQPIRDLLHNANLPWLNSLEFCTGYDPDPAAERVWLKMDSGKIQHAVFYCVRKRIGFLKTIEIIGFSGIDNDDVNRLIKMHKAQLAVVNRMEEQINPDEQWQSKQANVYFKTYITIAQLPTTKEDFLNQLGRNKKEQLPRFWRKLNNHCDKALELRCETKEQIKMEDIIQLECLNRERRASKGNGVMSVRDIQERQKLLYPLTQTSGLLVTLRHEGKIIGGTFNYVHGNGAYNVITAHDTTLDNIRVGALSTWKTMEHLIDIGLTEYNFLWGSQSYKTQFLGVRHPWSITIVSPYQWLGVAWKYQIMAKEFYIRAWRFVKTKFGFRE